MSSDADMLGRVRQAFGGCRRPEHFTDFTHCPECAEHDAVLRSRDLETLRIEDVGNPGWDPICFISAEGLAYYVPALARLALAEPDPVRGWYGGQFLWHLGYEGPRNRLLRICTPAQRRVVVELLHHLAGTRARLVDGELCMEDLAEALRVWSDGVEEA